MMEAKEGAVTISGVYGAEAARLWRRGVSLDGHPLVVAEWVTQRNDWNSYKVGRMRYMSLAVPARSFYAAGDWIRTAAKIRGWGRMWRGKWRWDVRVATLETRSGDALTISAHCGGGPVRRLAVAVQVWLGTYSNGAWIVEHDEVLGRIYIEMDLGPSNVALASALWGEE